MTTTHRLTGVLAFALALTARAAGAQSVPPPPPPSLSGETAMVMTQFHPYLVPLLGSVPVSFVAVGSPVVISALQGSFDGDANGNPPVAVSMFAQRATPWPYHYLCTTPCTLYLRPGGTTLHTGSQLEMSRDVTIDVVPGERRRISLRTVSIMRPFGGITLTMFGGFVATTAVALTVLGAAIGSGPTVGTTVPGSTHSASSADLVLAGSIVGFVSGALIAAGVHLIATSHAGIEHDSREPLHWQGVSAAPTRDGQGAMVATSWRF